jgi:phosphoenolpyruvate carboxykinase (ATP)
MITAALEGKLDHVEYRTHRVFGLEMPTSCPEVPAEILSPRHSWKDMEAYDAKANLLAEKFINNFKKFEDGVSQEIRNAAPKVRERDHA